MGRFLLLASLLVLVAAGCGRTEIDRAKAESFVRSYFTPDASAAECPGGIEAKEGRTFSCTAVDTDGRPLRVTVHILDDEGRVRIGSGDVRAAP